MTANDNDDKRMLVQFTAADLRAIVRDEVERAMGPLAARVKGQQQAAADAAAASQAKSTRWTDVAGAATHFGCSKATIHNWIKAGAPAKQFGPTSQPMVRIDLPEFEAWVEQAQQVQRRRRSKA